MRSSVKCHTLINDWILRWNFNSSIKYYERLTQRHAPMNHNNANIHQKKRRIGKERKGK